MYCRLEALVTGGSRSPVVFLHGFPDSPRMWDAYWTEDERRQTWLRGRSVYAVALPNRVTNPEVPPLLALANGVLQDEVGQLLDGLVAGSPTGQLVIVAHDWGATFTWAHLRRHPQAWAGVERLVALSVGSSFRYDVLEHGPNAIGWAYSALFGAPYWLPLGFVRRALAAALAVGGYRSEDHADTVHRDSYHYWYGPLVALGLVGMALGLRYEREFLDFRFPVLFVRSPMDRLASTRAFEAELQRRPDCRLVLLPGQPHWFPEQQPERVLQEIRAFVSDGGA